MVKILFKGLNSNDYRIFCNTITTFEFLLKFAELYSEFTLEFIALCGENYKRIWKVDNELHVAMRLMQVSRKLSKIKDSNILNNFREVLASRYTKLIENLRKIAVNYESYRRVA